MRGLTGGDWYRNRALKKVLEVLPDNKVASGVCLVDFVGYRSHQWHSALRVSSSDYTISQVNAAIDRDAVIILLRSGKEWLTKIPRLARYPRIYRNRSWQQVMLSENNTSLGLNDESRPGAFTEIIRNLEAG